MIVSELSVDRVAFEQATGWELKPQGACRGELCVPLQGGTVDSSDRVDVARLADQLGMPVVADEAAGLWALGPATMSGRALLSAHLPALDLIDLDGQPFDFATLRGKKVVLVAWSPY